MAITETSINPNIIPPSPPVNGNVSSLVNKNTLNTLNSIKTPLSFGDQTLTGQKIIKATGDSTLVKLQKEKLLLIQEEVQLDIDHQKTLLELSQKNTPQQQIKDGQVIDVPPQLNDEEYQKLVDIEEKNYEEAKKIIQTKKEKNQEDIDDFLNDPFKKQKEELTKRKENRKKAQSKNKAERNKAKKEKIKAILKNGAKTLVPIFTLLISNKIAEVISQNQKIKKLVNDTNAIIIDANTTRNPLKLSNAKIVRDNAIKIIQSNEDKIIKIKEQIQRITIYLNIFSTIVSIISSIPLPTSVPPGVGIPTSLIIRFVKILEKANKIFLSLSALIPILLSSLDKAISILADLKSQLLDINGQLEAASAAGIPGLDGMGGTGVGENGGRTNFGSFSTSYKGFTFAIREESGPRALVVRGNKRHYAVAIDTNKVEVLKSESSFTLDPNDLVDQLKLIIDRENLIA